MIHSSQHSGDKVVSYEPLFCADAAVDLAATSQLLLLLYPARGPIWLLSLAGCPTTKGVPIIILRTGHLSLENSR